MTSWKIPYGSKVYVKNNKAIKAGTLLFSWDPYTDVILSRSDGFVRFKDFIEGETYSEEAVESGKKIEEATELARKAFKVDLHITQLSLRQYLMQYCKMSASSLVPHIENSEKKDHEPSHKV